MNDFIREINEEIKADRAREIFKKYGKWMIAAAVLLVLATAAFVAWRSYRYEQNAQQGAELITALNLLDKGEAASSANALAVLAKKSNSTIGAISELHRARALYSENKRSEALTLYSSIAENPAYDQQFRDLSLLLSGYIWVGIETPDRLQSRLAPLIKPTNIWHSNATEILALSYMNAKNYSEAKTLLQAIAADDKAVATIKTRAGQLLQSLESAKGSN